MNTDVWHAQGLEGSQTSPRRLKLREATSGKPPGIANPAKSVRRSFWPVRLASPQWHRACLVKFIHNAPAKSDVIHSIRQFYRMANRRLPGRTRRDPSTKRLCSDGAIRTLPLELLNRGPIPGAVCCQLAELPNYPAAAGRAPVQQPDPLRGCNSDLARYSNTSPPQPHFSSTSTNAERQTPNAERKAPCEALGNVYAPSVSKLLVLVLVIMLEMAAFNPCFGDPVTPLSSAPDWDHLQKFQGTITHDQFLHLLNDVYAIGSTAQKWIKVEPDYAEIQTSGKHRLKLKFAKESGKPVSKYWHDPRTLPSNHDQPLAGLTIVLDPGHLGGSWAKMEERWFQIENAEPIKEGDLTLKTAKLLAPDLQQLGAKVVFVHSNPGPVTSLRPDDLCSDARASLKSRGVHPILQTYKGPADPEKEHSVTWEAERLFYRVAEIHERAKRVNRALKPDLTVCLHFNAEPWGDPANPTLTDIDHLHLIVNGAYAESELAYADVRYQMLLKLLSQSFDEEVSIAESIAHSLSETTKLPAYRYNSDNAHPAGTSGYVWVRNLLANRLYQCPVAYVECYVMNSRDFFDRFQAGEYDGQREFNGGMHKNIYAEYAEGVAEGLADYFRAIRGTAGGM
jgi:N-acetylmuramoyl-L-alanine amidase